MAGWSVFCVATQIRDNFLSAVAQRKYATLALLPQWHWYVWALGFLVALVIMVFEGAYQAFRSSVSQPASPSRQSLPPIDLTTIQGNNRSQEQRESASDAKHPRAEPKPFIKFIRSEYIMVHQGIESPALYRTPPHLHGDAKAAVLSFRNEGRPNRTVFGMRASARFFDGHGDEIGNGISGMLWLNNGASATLKPDESLSLIVLVKGAQLFVPYAEKERVRGRSMYLLRHYIVETLPNKVEIRLRDGNDDFVMEPLIVSVTNDDDELLLKT